MNNKMESSGNRNNKNWFARLFSADKQQKPPTDSYIDTQKSNNNDTQINFSVIFQKGKKHFIKGMCLYFTVLLVLVGVAISNMMTVNNNNQLNTFSTVTQDFVQLNRVFQNAISDRRSINNDTKKISTKSKKDILSATQIYPFIDAVYLMEKQPLGTPQIITRDFEIYNTKTTTEAYKLYSETIASEIKNILQSNIITKAGFYYWDSLNEKSILYVMPVNNSHYIVMRLNQAHLSEYYHNTHNIHIFFKNKAFQEANPDNKFRFALIHNIDALYYENTEFVPPSTLVFYTMFFIVINIMTIMWYRALSRYAVSEAKIPLLMNEINIAQKNKNGDENRTEHLIEFSNLISWTVNPATNSFTYINEKISDITGIAHEVWLTRGFWVSHIHEDDRNAVFKAMNDIKNQQHVTIEYRTYNIQGDIVWLRNTLSQSSNYNSLNDETGLIQGFLTDITDQKKVVETLEKARLAAEKASQMKSNFLASMSHELRTPLNSIIGFADIISSIEINNNQKYIKEYSENILSSGKHLLDLINDILDYSKIEAGAFEIRIEPTLINDIFKSCQILLQKRAETAGISLIVKAPNNELMVSVDPVRIKQVVINLVTNAIKFNRKNGKVVLEYEIQRTNELTIKVTDTGIGMKPEDLKIALEKFRQVDSDRNRNQEGTGLGLSISKSLVELHGGQLNIKSIYGKGTQVILTFPSDIIYVYDANNRDIA